MFNSAVTAMVVGGGGGRESLEVRDEEGGVGKGGVLSGQPDLVAAIPSQRVQVSTIIFVSIIKVVYNETM